MKRLIAVLTAGAMGAAVLTGCGGGQTAETAGESTSAAETAAEAETTEADSETGEENASSLDKLVFTYVTSPLNVPSSVRGCADSLCRGIQLCDSLRGQRSGYQGGGHVQPLSGSVLPVHEG